MRAGQEGRTGDREGHLPTWLVWSGGTEHHLPTWPRNEGRGEVCHQPTSSGKRWGADHLPSQGRDAAGVQRLGGSPTYLAWGGEGWRKSMVGHLPTWPDRVGQRGGACHLPTWLGTGGTP